jgi:hypothetical protein
MPPQNRSTKASPSKDVDPAAVLAEIESQAEAEIESQAEQAERQQTSAEIEPQAEQTDRQQTEAVRVEEQPKRPATLRLPLPFNRQMLVQPGAIPGWLMAEPAGKRLLWLGGLGAMATIGLLDWPVAVAVGAGSYITEQLAREQTAQRAVQAPAPPRISS